MKKVSSIFSEKVVSSAEELNKHCFCQTLNFDRLHQQLEVGSTLDGVMASITQTHPHLFASSSVFLSNEMEQKIKEAISAIERVVSLPKYQSFVLSSASEIAKHQFGPRGVCMGYDFHLSDEGPKLIEINTNAGGLLLNLALARAQESCCVEMDQTFIPNQTLENMEKTIFDMFFSEWKSQRGNLPLGLIAIVDDEPATQYLAPEFELFQSLFKSHGIEAVIVDPKELTWRDNALWYKRIQVDLIYNRLTDFYLEEPSHQDLKIAYETDAVVLTPAPFTHLVYADKRNLITLSQNEQLKEWGVTQQDLKILNSCIPKTRRVRIEDADELWGKRKHLFFKPCKGYASKAAYRGDKLTKKVWEQILQGEFVAQELVPPSERLIEVDGQLNDLKFDVRVYTYAGNIQLMAARIYSGQTTNFRTEGGGFAPVVIVTKEV